MRNIDCYFDGACDAPGGKIGYGFVIYEENKIIFEDYWHYPQKETNTNNVAEYLALINCFFALMELGLEKENVTIKGDSNMVIQQMIGNWDMKKKNYYPYGQAALEIKEKSKLDFYYEWIPREENKYADKLSKKGLEETSKIAI